MVQVARGWQRRRIPKSIVCIGLVAVLVLSSTYRWSENVKAYYWDDPYMAQSANDSDSPTGRTSTANTSTFRSNGSTTTPGQILPPFLAKDPVRRRYPSKSIFLHSEGYQPNGGALPFDAADYLENPRMWRYIDNTTCMNKSSSTTTIGHADSVPQEWQYRAPYAILLGAMKAGTHAVIESLWDHPLVVPTLHWELHFYDSPKAIRNEMGIQRDTTLRNYAHAVKKAVGPNISVEASFVWNETNNDKGRITPMIMVESSPKYILTSDRTPEMILCVSPWVKLLAILRNPVARVESHYRFLDESRKTNKLAMVDWQVWIDDDLRLLQKAGVLNATTPEEEFMAWKFYQRRPHSQQIVGRGLYVIPLEQYLRAMEEVGKPRSDLYIMQSELFLENRQEEYDKLLNFLELPLHHLSKTLSTQIIHKTLDGATPMPDHIRRQLETLYRPYNARLYDLLGWESVWG